MNCVILHPQHLDGHNYHPMSSERVESEASAISNVKVLIQVFCLLQTMPIYRMSQGSHSRVKLNHLGV